MKNKAAKECGCYILKPDLCLDEPKAMLGDMPHIGVEMDHQGLASCKVGYKSPLCLNL
jgi:hypothetical protein